MALRMYDLTLSGNTRAIATHLPVTELRIENPTGNATVLFGTVSMTASSYAGSVLAGPANAVRIGPLPAPTLNLDEIYFRGTDTEVIHLAVITP